MHSGRQDRTYTNRNNVSQYRLWATASVHRVCVCGGAGHRDRKPSDKKQGILVSEDQSHKSCRFQSALGIEKDRAQMVGVI